jgi:hypothetical protein
MTRRELQAIKECARWLKACLDLGWSKQDLEHLEDLWWRYHDTDGNLK